MKEFIKEVDWKTYRKHLPVAEMIYESLFPKPKTSREVTNGFNIRGEIIRVLIQNERT